jgi:polyisoprenoid-binding protein YceI
MKSTVLALALALALAACQKEEKAADTSRPDPKAETSTAQTTRTEQPAPKTEQPEPEPAGDYIRIVADHAQKKPNDPVIVSIPTFKVVSASFDPQTIEGGTATLELDLSSLTSGSAKRDKHLLSDDYLDVARFGTATIVIDNVKKAGDKGYTADARVNVHGIEKTLPVTFEVLETMPDGIRVKGAHQFARLDFGIGQAPGPDDSVAEQITLELELTLKKS